MGRNREGRSQAVRAGALPAGSFTGHDGATWHFSVPNAAHGKKCAEHRADVEGALSAAVGSPITIVIGEGANDDPDHPTSRNASPTASSTSPGTAAGSAPSGVADGTAADAPGSVAADDEPFDPDELTDAPAETGDADSTG